MDKERLGRILGSGARHAARTAYQAVDAAMAPDPKVKSRPQAASANSQAASTRTPSPSVAQQASQQLISQPRRNSPSTQETIATAMRTAQAVHQGQQRMKQAALNPIKRAGRSLALEIFGSFFLLFAASFLVAAWKVHTGMLRPGDDRNHFVTFCFFAVIFGYFGVSSFLRAKKK